MAKRDPEEGRLEDDPLWFRDAVIYEVHVRSFFDSDGDGIGDFRGLTEKLDYLKDLGVTAIWVLPFYPSPLKDDGYDIADYTGVHPHFGTLRDFKTLLREAHRRGIRVITELVLNHTSDQHPWFQRARRAKPKSAYRDFYVWSDNQEKYKDARIIFKDFETSNWEWDPVAKAYYWHRFYAHQPDLNYDSPRVRRAVREVVDFWLGLGVDGLRLDAVPYLFEREGTSCENLPETHAFLKELRAHVYAKFKNRMILAEANQWPEEAADYFSTGDECHMAFHFPLMPRLFMALRLEDRFPIVEILNQTPPIPENAQWALFLRNHDELTLEMVTDEERDYMYRMYAQDRLMRINLGIRRRLGPLLENDRKKIELMLGLLFSLPGSPVIYYGDEIGMGDNYYLGDRDGVRTPMQWSADRNAGFSKANPQRLHLPIIIDPAYHYEANNVETNTNNPHSLLWWLRRLIARRKRYKAFGRGTIDFLYPENRKVFAFVRQYDKERILVVANLSRHPQCAELDLSRFQGTVPVELGGSTPFPPIEEEPYLFTLDSYSFYWFSLQKLEEKAGEPLPAAEAEVPILSVSDNWRNVLRGRARSGLEAALPDHLARRRWYGGKARTIQTAEIEDVIPVSGDATDAVITIVRVEYLDGESAQYVLPLTYVSGEPAVGVQHDIPHTVIARLRIKDTEEEGVLFDAFWDRTFLMSLLDATRRHRRLRGSSGEIAFTTTRAFRRLIRAPSAPLDPSPLKAEQSNTSALYGDRLILKLYRRLEIGPNPELEIGWFLTERVGFPHIPPLAGALTYGLRGFEPMTLAIVQAYVPNEGDAWQYTLDAASRYFDRPVPRLAAEGPPVLPRKSLLDLSEEDPTPLAVEAIGPYLESARLLGQRTAELHAALAENREDPSFAPEPFTFFYQRALFHSMVALMDQSLALLRRKLSSLPEPVRGDAQRVLDLEAVARKRFQPMRERRIAAMRIRCHGDYHLGQVLYTGKDFSIIDFEGEPARSVGERRIKRSPMRDVAGMIRSFHYAAHSALRAQTAAGPDASVRLEPWARLWYVWVSSAFLQSYLQTAAASSLLPEDREDLQVLLDVYLLDKAFYELGYELNNRPDWVGIPLTGILHLLEPGG